MGRERIRLTTSEHRAIGLSLNRNVGRGYSAYKDIMDYDTKEKRPVKRMGMAPNPKKPPLFERQPSIKLVILKALKRGHRYETACAYAGISTTLFIKWLRWGKEGKKPYNRFYKSVRRAEANAENEALRNVRRAGRNEWKASAWILERRHGWTKQEGGVQERHISGQLEVNHKVEIHQEMLNSPDRREIARRMIDGNEWGYSDTALEKEPAE